MVLLSRRKLAKQVLIFFLYIATAVSFYSIIRFIFEVTDNSPLLHAEREIMKSNHRTEGSSRLQSAQKQEAAEVMKYNEVDRQGGYDVNTNHEKISENDNDFQVLKDNYGKVEEKIHYTSHAHRDEKSQGNEEAGKLIQSKDLIIKKDLNQNFIPLENPFSNHNTMDNSLSTERLKDLDIVTPLPKPRRKGLIIVAHGRSGSSYTFQVFNQNPFVFSAYEPLLMAERWKVLRNPEGNFNQTDAVIDLLYAFMTCTFSKSVYGARFLKDYSAEYRLRLYSRVLKSPPFCDIPGKRDSCKSLEPKQVDEACLSRRFSAVKIMYMRLPDQSISILSHVLKKLEDVVDMKLIHLIRDPRGNINSRINLGLMKRMIYDPDFSFHVKQQCDLIEMNFKIGEEIAEIIPDKYRLLRYKDIAMKPLETAQELYNYTGFEMTSMTKEWLQTYLRPGRVDGWKSESPLERTRIIETNCQSLFKLLNIQNEVL